VDDRGCIMCFLNKELAENQLTVWGKKTLCEKHRKGLRNFVTGVNENECM